MRQSYLHDQKHQPISRSAARGAGRNAIRKACMAAFLVLSMLLSGCTSTASNPFPKVTQPLPTSSATITSEPPVTPAAPTPSEQIVLKVGAPISSKTADYLVKLYSAKQTDSLGSGINGSNVSLDVLDSQKTNFTVEILQTPSTGATLDTISQWEASGFVPDIIFTDAMASLETNGKVLPLTNYIASNSLYLPGIVSPSMLNSCSMNNQLYGIPYAASAQILFVNMDVLAKAGVDQVPFHLDLDTLTSIATAVHSITTDKTPISEMNLAFYRADEFLPFLASSYADNAGWFMFNGSGFDFHAPAFGKSISYLRSFVDNGFSLESLSKEDQVKAFDSLDPRLSNRVAMWIGNTEDISFWTTNTAYTLSITQIPSETAQSESPPALTVYPLCISASSKNAQLASDFASFMALDEDAVLLTARLEKPGGYLPVISSSTVWNAVMAEQTFGQQLLQFRTLMGKAYYNPISNHESAYLLINQMLTDTGGMLLDKKTDLTTVIPLLANAQISA